MKTGILAAIIAVILVGIIGIGYSTGFFAATQGNSGSDNGNGNNNNGTGTIEKFGTFTYNTAGAVEKIDGKPVVRLFSTTWCPHCIWIKDTFDSTVQEYVAQGKIVAYHWELDTGDNTLTSEIETSVPASEQAVFQKFNPDNSIPTFVFGGKYYRVGNAFESQQDLEKEKAEFRAMIEQLLNE